jgi:hypothetical protein
MRSHLPQYKGADAFGEALGNHFVLSPQEFRKRAGGVLRDRHDFAQITDLMHGLPGFIRAAVQFKIDGLVADGTNKRLVVAIHVAPLQRKGLTAEL